jgi:hypothetical protein
MTDSALHGILWPVQSNFRDLKNVFFVEQLCLSSSHPTTEYLVIKPKLFTNFTVASPASGQFFR